MQINLPKQEYWAAKRKARKLGISLVELLGRSLRQVLPSGETKPWMHYVGMVESGDSNFSEPFDDFVYGAKS